MNNRFLSLCLAACLLPFAAMAAENAVVSPEPAAEKPAGALPTGLRAAAEAAAARGAAYLASIQQEDGHWSSPDTPALTALAFWALLETDSAAYAEAIDRAVAFVLRFAHADGSIFRDPAPGQFGGGLANYNTAVCMMALFALGRGELVPLVQQARRYVASTQNLGGSVYRGGMGYDPATGREYADLSNSYLSYEAMKATEAVEDLRAEGEEKADLDWDAVQEFLAQVQNLPGVNPQPWAGAEADDVGGFVYTPAAGGRPAGGSGEGRPAAPPAARDGAKPPAAA
ncbi:MAG: terpene cyclase/mutase family protein, partial [Kiritimatiellae bacterium]|nr:terpene cyclase/mutase family protein [Kiritimatiellia bacterium]